MSKKYSSNSRIIKFNNETVIAALAEMVYVAKAFSFDTKTSNSKMSRQTPEGSNRGEDIKRL
jgi:hypothetical protein